MIPFATVKVLVLFRICFGDNETNFAGLEIVT
jgi:hypothetical protein